ncbi:Uu.00g110130.m01.CDS01 [Anthostomella pinea]|uniref:Uu.00g110130.m01.CDS01 n=1 Tax=Anthostomella pinea TaxID=933095 RepID=A0AAI8VEV8_9PEZI|nr:Uu.00g110130.m01.CDS01 [Anthostomella pinea]
MVNVRSITAVLATSALIGQAIAHPGEKHTPAQIKREVAAQHHANHKMTRALNACASKPSFVARKERAIARRAETAKSLRQKRGIEHKAIHAKRDQAALERWMAVSHNQTAEGYNLDTPADTLFSGNATCALVEDTTIGPYWGQAGVPLHLELEFVDVSDCSPVSDMIADIWHCNATGVYSVVSSMGQGGLDSTFLRGAQISDTEGGASFDSIFPGHYTGRAPHIHVLTTKQATVLTNQTYEGGVATHIGQLFFDQSLITAVELSAPYTANEQELTTNADDDIAAGEATEDYDIFMDYALLGDAYEDGLMAWITIGIDSSANQTAQVQAAAHHYDDGGVDTSDGQTGPGGPPPTKARRGIY